MLRPVPHNLIIPVAAKTGVCARVPFTNLCCVIALPAKLGRPATPGPTRGEQGSRQLSQVRAAQPKAAASSRDVNVPPVANTISNGPAQLLEQQLDQIKEAVYRDLMDKIRIEFERGG